MKIAGTISISLATFILTYSYCHTCKKKKELNWWNMIPILFALVTATFILKFVELGKLNLILPDITILFFVLIFLIFRKFITKLIVNHYGKYAIKIHVNLNLLFIAIGLLGLVLTVYIVSFFIEKYLDFPNRFFGIGKLILFSILWSYITVKVYFLKNYMSEEEYWPILNEAGKVVGYESKECVYFSKTLKKNNHPVIRILLIFDNKLFLKKYGSCDFYYPGKWDISISGHLLYGETFESCISRLLKNNYNIEENNTRYLLKYTYENSYENQQVFLNYMYVNNAILQKADFSDVKPWSVAQIFDELNSNIFTDKLRKEIVMLKNLPFPYFLSEKVSS